MFRFKLRTLLIVLAIAPPLLAGVFYACADLLDLARVGQRIP